MILLGVVVLKFLDLFLEIHDILFVHVFLDEDHVVGLIEDVRLLLRRLRPSNVRRPHELLADHAKHSTVIHQNWIWLTGGACGTLLHLLHPLDVPLHALNRRDDLVQLAQLGYFPL